MIFRTLLIFLILEFVSNNSLARQLFDTEKKELVQLINDLPKTARRQDASFIVDDMPVRPYKKMAMCMHTTEVKLRDNQKRSFISIQAAY
ncbi:MAG: hypothetical protein JSC188_000751 [Candidatus Tokpelaia sp. JSC188]|nr:MAG: hypothetical protein JSC188_000751 [Candidatus Tokpelaia sp. JSC188]